MNNELSSLQITFKDIQKEKGVFEHGYSGALRRLLNSKYQQVCTELERIKARQEDEYIRESCSYNYVDGSLYFYPSMTMYIKNDRMESIPIHVARAPPKKEYTEEELHIRILKLEFELIKLRSEFTNYRFKDEFKSNVKGDINDFWKLIQ
ncbi:MAG: hypothetical protein WCS17_03975 [Prevotella sp.]